MLYTDSQSLLALRLRFGINMIFNHSAEPSKIIRIATAETIRFIFAPKH